jgi:hypothetical protein
LVPGAPWLLLKSNIHQITAFLSTHISEDLKQKTTMKPIKPIISSFAALTLVIAATSFAQSNAEPSASGEVSSKLLAREKWVQVDIEASVESINFRSREITLKGPKGYLLTLIASENVERFDEIMIGDSVSAEYRTFMRAEFREPTAEEKATPFIMLAEASKAAAEVDPASEIGAVVRAVVEVVDIDTQEKRVSIKGPRGNFMILPVEDDEVLNMLEVGELVVMTYGEALAISLNKM